MRTDAGPARPKRKKQAPSRGPQGLPGPRRTTYRPPQRTGVFAPGPPRPATRPITQAPARARQKVERAQRRLPERPVPTIPVLPHYTPQQIAVARALVKRSGINRAADGMQDPRVRARLRGAAAAGRSELRIQALRTQRAQTRLSAQEQAAYSLGQRLAVALGRGRMPKPSGTSLRQERIRGGRGLVQAQQVRDTVSPGRAHTKLRLPGATIDLTALDRNTFGALTAAATSGGSGAAGRFAADVVNLPKTLTIGALETARAGVEAAGGDTKRAKQLIGSLDDGVLGQLILHGDPKAAAKAFSEHPLFGALEVTGAGQAAGRLAGAGMRAGLLGRAAAERASTVRPDMVVVEGTGQVLKRSGSRNQIVREFQRSADARAPKDAQGRVVAQRSHVGRVAAPIRGHAKRDRDSLMDSSVDEFAAQGEATRRRGRQEMTAATRRMDPARRGDSGRLPQNRRQRLAAAADRALTQGKDASVRGSAARRRPERDIVFAAAEGRVQPGTWRADLGRERARLVAVARDEDLSRSTRLENARTVAAIDRALNDKAFDPRALFRAADAVKAESRRIETESVSRGVLVKDQAEAARLRPQAIAVLGLKDDPKPTPFPQAVARFQAAKVKEKAARDELVAVRQSVKQAERDLQEVRGKNKVQRGRDAAKGPQAAYHVGDRKFDTRAEAAAFAKENGGKVRKVSLTPREAARTGEAERARRALKAAKDRERVAKRKLADRKARRQELHPRKYATGLADGDGNRVSTQEIRARLEAEGRNPDDAAFLGHRRDTRGARSFFVNWFDRRQAVDSKRRTGEATRRGSHASDFNAVREDLIRRQGVLDAVDTFDAFIRHFAAKRPDGQHLTWTEAERYADELEGKTGVAWVPIRAFPARYDADRWGEIADTQAATPGVEAEPFMVRMLDEAQRKPDTQARNVVLVPERQIKRFRSHQMSSSSVGARAGQAVTGLFRTTVLPFSSKWIVGNVVEAGLRSALEGIGPGTMVKGHVAMRRMRALDEKAYNELDARVRGGLMFGSQENLRVRRAAEDFAESPTVESAARFGSLMARMPVVRHTLGGLQAMAHLSLGLNRGVERMFQSGVIGKQIRNEIRETTGSWTKSLGIQRQAIDDAARGLTNTPAQIRFAREADDVLGKYGRMSPSTRRFVQSYAPFLPWFLNAMRFVSYTLPVRHPLKTALVVRVGAATTQAWEAEHEGTLGSLKYGLPSKDGGWVDVARYMPFGAFLDGPGIVREQLLPQVQSPLLILSGLSWTLRPLRLEDGSEVGDGKKVAMALYSAAESFVPLLGIGRRLREGGETAYDDSTITSPKTKPGTSYGSSGARRVFDPFRPTHLGGGGGGTAAPAGGSRVQRDRIKRALEQAASRGPSAVQQDRIRRALERAGG